MSGPSLKCYFARFAYKPQAGRDLNCIEIIPGDVLEVNNADFDPNRNGRFGLQFENC